MDRLDQCERSYHFRYVQGIPDAKNPYSEFGKEGHAKATAYVETGVSDLRGDIGLSLSAGLHLLPRGQGVAVNQQLTSLDMDGIPVVGELDLQDESGEVPTIIDLKFKGASTYKDVKASEEFQLVAYAEDFRRRHPKATHINLRHLHFLRPPLTAPKEGSKRKAFVGKAELIPIADNVPLDAIKSSWEGLADSYGNRLRKVAATKDVADLPPSRGLEFCSAFGRRCPYADICPITAGQRIVSRIQKRSIEMGMLSKFQNGHAVAVPPSAIEAAPQAVQAKPIPVVPARALDVGGTYKIPSSHGTEGILEKLDGRIAHFLMHQGTPQAIRIAVSTESVGEMVHPAVALVLPPDAPLQAPAVQTIAPSGEVTTTTAPAGPKKRGPGRPKKGEADATGPSVVLPGDVLISGATAEKSIADFANALPKTVSRIDLVQSNTDVIRLYFGASPLGVETRTLGAYVAQLEKGEIEKLKLDVPDIRLSSNEALKFGRWKAVLQLAAKESPPPPGHYVVGEEEKELAVAEGLEPTCAPGCVVKRMGR